MPVRLASVALSLLLFLLTACSSGSDGTTDGTDIQADAATGDGSGELAGTCLEDGAPCDDGDPCTRDDQCQGGLCTGESYTCEAAACVTVECDGAGGCLDPVVVAGFCLVDDLCLATGEALDGDACWVCDPTQYTDQLVPAETGAACEDGNICTENDFCDNGDCLAGSPPTCADGVQCTIDVCDAELGCIHEPDHEMCNDDQPCTADLCDPENATDELGCVNNPDDSLICSDKDVCTKNDHCDGGLCVSDPETEDCDDLNECTVDSCHPAYGCLHVFLETVEGADPSCDDGAVCTEEDVCHFGKCIGTEPYWGACPACDLSFSDDVVKIVNLRVGDGGFPGEALNVDNDPKTCSPSGNCELGLDNSLDLAGDFIDETIAQNLANVVDPLIFTAEFVDPDFEEGSEFTLNVYYAFLSEEAVATECDFQHDSCLYEVSGLNFDPLCQNQVVFTNAKVQDGVLKAGGSGFIFPFKASFKNGESAETVLYAAKVEATVTLDEQGKVESMNGVIGGALTTENLSALILAIPEEYIPVDPELLVTFIENLPQDIDLNGDGTMDASSIALVFTTIPGQLAPYTK